MSTASPLPPLPPDAPHGALIESPDDSPTVTSTGGIAAAVAAMAFVWALLTIVTMIAVSMPGALGASHPVSFSRAVFTAVNAGTHSGFSQQFAADEDFATSARRMLAIDTAGGIVFSLVGGALVLRRTLNLPVRLGHLLLAVAILLVVASLTGLAALQGTSIVDRCLAGVAALGGAGPSNRLGKWSPMAVKLLLTPVALLGSVGALGVLATLGIGSPAKLLYGLHIRNVLLVAAGVYGGGLFISWALLAGAPGLADSPLQSANALTLAARGFGTPIDFGSAWPRSALWPVIAIGLVGVGTLGAMPSLGLAWLITLPRRVWPAVLMLLAVHGGVILAALVGLSYTERQLAPDRILLLAISAAAKTGLSHEAVSIDGPGLLILAAVMAISKLLPLGLLVAASPRIYNR